MSPPSFLGQIFTSNTNQTIMRAHKVFENEMATRINTNHYKCLIIKILVVYYKNQGQNHTKQTIS